MPRSASSSSSACGRSRHTARTSSASSASRPAPTSWATRSSTGCSRPEFIAADNPHSPRVVTSDVPLRSAREASTRMHGSHTGAIDLHWIPLGAGGHVVRFNGRVFEAIEAARKHRRRRDLYHAALVVELDGDSYTIEVAPSPDADGAKRGVVATGAVGSRYAGW